MINGGLLPSELKEWNFDKLRHSMHSSRMMSASTSATAHQAEDAFSPVGTNPHALPVNDVPPEDESSSAIDDDEHSSVQGSASVKSAKLELARKETKMVLRSRVVFCLFLGIVAVVTGIATHRVSVDVEDRDFETRVCWLMFSETKRKSNNHYLFSLMILLAKSLKSRKSTLTTSLSGTRPWVCS